MVSNRLKVPKVAQKKKPKALTVGGEGESEGGISMLTDLMFFIWKASLNSFQNINFLTLFRFRIH